MRIFYWASYLLFILREIVAGSLRIAVEAFTPGTSTKPAIIEYHLAGTYDFEVIALASSITITPGTLVLGTASGNSEEGATLYVHAMFADSREEVVASLRDMEDRLLRASRGKEGARLAREAEYEYQRRHANDPKEQA
ncbi:Na+/H+ antiporter subunit E [Dermabacteraceae bacterium P13115]